MFLRKLTLPKVTIFLKSGNIVKTRWWPSHVIEIDDMLGRLKKREEFDLCREENRECVSVRKWWQKWA